MTDGTSGRRQAAAVWPTGAEMARMPWAARQRLAQRIRAAERATLSPPADWPPERVQAAHDAYVAGETAPWVTTGETEYQRRRAAWAETTRKRAARAARVKSPRVREHLIRLLDAGLDLDEIAHRADLKPSAVRRVHDRIVRPGRSTVQKSHADALLAVPVPDPTRRSNAPAQPQTRADLLAALTAERFPRLGVDVLAVEHPAIAEQLTGRRRLQGLVDAIDHAETGAQHTEVA